MKRPCRNCGAEVVVRSGHQSLKGILCPACRPTTIIGDGRGSLAPLTLEQYRAWITAATPLNEREDSP